MVEQVDTQEQSSQEITFKVTKVVTYKYKYPMESNELYDARQVALESNSSFMDRYANDNDSEVVDEEVTFIEVVEGDGENDWFE